MIYLLTFIILLLIMIALGLNLLFGKKSIQGSCSQLGQMDEKKDCGNCHCKNLSKGNKGTSHA